MATKPKTEVAVKEDKLPMAMMSITMIFFHIGYLFNTP